MGNTFCTQFQRMIPVKNETFIIGKADQFTGTEGLQLHARHWSKLYKVAGYASVLMLVFLPVQLIVYFNWPPPTTVTGWFELFNRDAIIGLLDMDLLLSIDYILLGLVFLALYVSLRRGDPSLSSIALTLQLLAIAIYFASTGAFEMLTLSTRYAAATTSEQRAVLLAAGETTLASWQGTAFNSSYVLGAAALLIISFVMLRTPIFTRATGYVGILMGLLMIVPPTAGEFGTMLSLFSLIPLVPWLILLSRKFFMMADLARKKN